LEKLAWEIFPSQHKPYGREYLAALRAHPQAPSDAELADFLRALAKDDSLATARQPLAVAAKSDRLDEWIKRRRRLRVVVPRPPRGGVEQVTEAERAEVRTLLLSWTKKGRQA
jgi:hypothetical protein